MSQLEGKTAIITGGASGIRVNCICPGGIVTPFITNAFGGGDAVAQGVAEQLAQRQPIRRAGQPEDIAQAALWLASDTSSFVNAQAIVVDGGLTGGRQPTGPPQPWLSDPG